MMQKTQWFLVLLQTTVMVSLGFPAHAEQSSARLWYAVEADLEGCPNVGSFQDRVAARVGYVPFSRDASVEIDVRISTDGSNLQGTITVRGGETTDQSREFTASEGECEQLADAMALAVAIRIDPVAVESVPSPPPPTPVPTPPSQPSPAPSANIVESMRHAVAGPNVGPATSDGEVPIRFEGIGEEIMLHRRAATVIGYSLHQPLCVAPCNTSLPTGIQRLALSMRGRNPIESREPVMIQGPSLVTGTYHSRRWSRIGMIIGGTAGLIAGMVMMLVGTDSADELGESPMWISGVVLMSVGTLVGAATLLVRDRVEFEVTPL